MWEPLSPAHVSACVHHVCAPGKDFIAVLWRWDGVFQVISSKIKHPSALFMITMQYDQRPTFICTVVHSGNHFNYCIYKDIQGCSVKGMNQNTRGHVWSVLPCVYPSVLRRERNSSLEPWTQTTTFLFNYNWLWVKGKHLKESFVTSK